jgi:hypothetical protein
MEFIALPQNKHVHFMKNLIRWTYDDEEQKHEHHNHRHDW